MMVSRVTLEEIEHHSFSLQAFDNKRMTGGPATFELSAQNSEITIDRLSSLKVAFN